MADVFLRSQTLWVTAALALVYISLVLGLGPALRWAGLVLALLPFPFLVARRGVRSLRTPFDVPIALFLCGAVVGFCVSDNRTISLGPLQCVVGVTLFYYSWVNSEGLAKAIKWGLVSLAIVGLLSFLFIILEFTISDGHFGVAIRGSGTHHGLAMYLGIMAALLLGMAAFDGDRRIRLSAAFLCLVFLVIVVVMTWKSLNSLVQGVSLSGRWPIWQDTAEMLGDSPFKGLGLGCWALQRWDTTVLGTDTIDGSTHAHNAYLELYSNTGVVGVLAILLALGIGAKLSLEIVRSRRTHPWYGFGVGVVAACVGTLLVAVLESAPMGVPLVADETYYYVVSPVAWLLCGLLAMAHRQVAKRTE